MAARLFVYGTLRKDSRRSMHHLLARHAEFVGHAQIPGRLYLLDGYPGLVPSSEHHAWVRGDVYVLEDSSEVLARLDDYEGCGPNDAKPYEFERVQREVVLESGESVLAWVYVYGGSVAGKREILSGDYCRPIEGGGSETQE